MMTVSFSLVGNIEASDFTLVSAITTSSVALTTLPATGVSFGALHEVYGFGQNAFNYLGFGGA